MQQARGVRAHILALARVAEPATSTATASQNLTDTLRSAGITRMRWG